MESTSLDPKDLWFNTPDSPSLCRGGGNGPHHPSQLYAIKKYVTHDMTFLDYGSGSATTFEAILEFSEELGQPAVLEYLGLDIIPKNVQYCLETWPEGNFEVNNGIHKIDQPDKSWDVVFSRHVVDHMESFEKALDEHKRVARQLVIVVLWVPLGTSDEHEIKNIHERGNDTTYKNEYTNSYSKKRVMEYLLGDPEWKLVELAEEVGHEVSGHDTVIVLEKQ